VSDTSRICMVECRAGCCRGPQWLRLTAEEIAPFQQHARRLGVEARVRLEADGTGAVRYLEHEGERCPMLDAETFACRIYAERPQRCRAFPEGPRPGCAISGWTG